MTLILNADDFGYDSNRNLAVVQCFQKGLCSSATIMANMAGFDEAVELAHQHGLRYHLGLHLALTEGPSLTESVRKCARFCDRDGRFQTSRRTRLWRLSAEEKEALALEIRAQIDKCRRAGLCLTHLDSHNHVHEEWAVFELLVRLMKEAQIRYLRLGNTEARTSVVKQFYRSILNLRIRQLGLARTRHMGVPDDYLASGQAGSSQTGRDNAWELMLHPALDNQGRLVDHWLKRPLEPMLRDLPGLDGAVSYAGTRYLSISCRQPGPAAPEPSTVSVIIPAYNSARTLGRAVHSALEQTLPPKEVIVVDDGSWDDTRKVVRALEEPRLRYLWQENRGPAAARNQGIAAAQGEYLAFLDADDYWRPGFLEACVEFLAKHPEAVAVSTGLCIKRVGGPTVFFPPDNSGMGTQPPLGARLLDDFFTFWACHDHVRTGSCLLRKSVVERAGGQLTNLRSTEDLEYWGYVATFGKWGFIPDPLWVGDSEAAAAATGWEKKNSVRRRQCPTVEEWQRRILPRLRAEDRPGFEIVRWRIATSLAQDRILAGAPNLARSLVARYAKAQPRSWLTELLKVGHRFGAVGWYLACVMVVARERQKVAWMGFRAAWDRARSRLGEPLRTRR